jgi:hypothetical protein
MSVNELLTLLYRIVFLHCVTIFAISFSMASNEPILRSYYCHKSHSISAIYQQAHQKVRTSMHDLDTFAIRRSYAQFRRDSQNSPFALNSPLVDISFLGFLGEVVQISLPKSASEKPQFSLRPDVIERKRVEYQEKLSQVRPESIEKVTAQVHRLLAVRTTSTNRKILTAKLVSHQELHGFEQALLHRFQLIGMKTVDFVYRTSGLEKARNLTGATMMDEVRSIIKEGRGYNIHLSYSPEVLELELKLIGFYYQRWESTTDELARQQILNEMNQGHSPFLPANGVVSTDYLFPTGAPTELKRYFHNPFPEALGMTEVNKVELSSNESIERMSMLISVIERLDSQSELEIHAHSRVHMRAYLKLGFSLYQESENPLYPGVKVYILRGEKKAVLQAINSTLNKLREAVSHSENRTADGTPNS